MITVGEALEGAGIMRRNNPVDKSEAAAIQSADDSGPVDSLTETRADPYTGSSAYLASASFRVSPVTPSTPDGNCGHLESIDWPDVSVNLIWYGKFTASQRAVLSDFVASLSAGGEQSQNPSVSSWLALAERYYAQSKAAPPRLTTGVQIFDEECSLGKSLKNADISALAARGRPGQAINVVLTGSNVAVEGFCMSRCASHGSSPPSKAGRFAYVWVGNSATQCPGQCAWPFHQPIYGPQAPPLVAPNGDVGVDGMVMNLASMIAGVVTNPFGGGFFMGPKTAPLEAATACPGIYGKGAYPGYAGELLVDAVTGASYNANGAHGRKYLLPGIFDPSTASCSTVS